jgi:hypothetical protein
LLLSTRFSHPLAAVCLCVDSSFCVAAHRHVILTQSAEQVAVNVVRSIVQVEAYREKLIASKEYQWVNFREQKYLMRLQYEAGEMAKLTT